MQKFNCEAVVNTSRFIVLEGIDGSGTTTQSSLLHDRLQKEGFTSMLTCEPTRSPIGDLIRSILRTKVPAHPETLAYLFAADRHDHLYNPETGMIKALSQGHWVILDRYMFSSLAYQTVQCSSDLVYTLNNNFPLPEITFFLDLNPEISLQRISTRDSEREIFEHIEFQLKVRSNYQQVFSQYSSRTKIVAVDASMDQDAVHQQIWDVISQRISMASP